MSLDAKLLFISTSNPQGADTSLSLASKQVLHEVYEKFASENKFSDESLLRLYGIFGSTFERALELYELERVKKICVKSEPGNSVNDARWLLQVTGISGEIYTLFPEVNFCSCASFRYRVLNDQAEHTCKHILAAWLSSVDNKKLSVQEIASPLFRDLMRFQVTF